MPGAGRAIRQAPPTRGDSKQLLRRVLRMPPGVPGPQAHCGVGPRPGWGSTSAARPEHGGAERRESSCLPRRLPGRSSRSSCKPVHTASCCASASPSCESRSERLSSRGSSGSSHRRSMSPARLFPTRSRCWIGACSHQRSSRARSLHLIRSLPGKPRTAVTKLGDARGDPHERCAPRSGSSVAPTHAPTTVKRSRARRASSRARPAASR